jgi:DNA-binding transcriptional MerR regulator
VNTFSISDIENLTGIKTQTIRKWEQRYNLLNARRTATNIRYYDDDDLRYFLNVATLLGHGYKISVIAAMNREQIATLITHLEKTHDNHVIINHLINATIGLNEQEMNKILNDCIHASDLIAAANQVIFPFMVKIGLMWQLGTLNPAHEHFATNLIRHKVIAAISGLPDTRHSRPMRALLFLPPNETHDTGLLLTHYLLKKEGHHVLYLGQDVPYYVLHETADYYQPDFALSALTLQKTETPGEIVAQLLKSLPHWSLVISGPLTTDVSIQRHERLTILKSFGEFEQYVEQRQGK